MRAESEDKIGELFKASDKGEGSVSEVKVETEIQEDSGVDTSEGFKVGVNEETKETGVLLMTGVKEDTEFDGIYDTETEVGSGAESKCVSDNINGAETKEDCKVGIKSVFDVDADIEASSEPETKDGLGGTKDSEIGVDFLPEIIDIFDAINDTGIESSSETESKGGFVGIKRDGTRVGSELETRCGFNGTKCVKSGTGSKPESRGEFDIKDAETGADPEPEI